MGRGVSQQATGMWVALAAACGVVLVDLLPFLGASPSLAAALVALSVGALALAAAVGAARRLRPVAPWRSVTSPLCGAVAPILRGRATDPTRHPLAPRAPGPA